MAYSQSQQQQYRMVGPKGTSYVVGPKNNGIPTAVHDIALNQQVPKYHPQQAPNNPNGYYPHQAQIRPYHNKVPPPVTASHKQHISQNKPHNPHQPQHRLRNSGSSSGPPLQSSSDEDELYGEEQVDANGQVVIIATDNYASNEPPPPQQYYKPPNSNYNDYQHHTYNQQHNGYAPNNTYVPPYAYNAQQVQNTMNGHGYPPNPNPNPNPNANSYGRPWQQPAPPPLPKHKMKNYSIKATSKYENGGHGPPGHMSTHYHPPPAHNLQFNTSPIHNNNNNNEDLPPDPMMHHKLSVASSAQFATSFDNNFDDNILGDDDHATDTFAPIHYDQRFSTDTSNLLKNRAFGQFAPEQQSQSPPLPQQQQQQQAQAPQRQSLSDSNPSAQQQKKKGSRARYKHQSDYDASSRSNSAQQQKEKHMNITITKSQTDSFLNEMDNKPSTPSKSSRNGSETRESDGDLEILARDKDYRPSIVSDLAHEDTVLNVTIDRYGFPMDDEMDEKEHRKQVKKENARLLKWQDMIFSKKSGGASAEEANETDLQIAHWNTVKNHRKLKSRIRKGVPQQLRGTVWQNLSGARERRKIECARYGSKNLYNDLRGRKKSKYHDQIWKDINRTYRKNLAYGASQLANAQHNQQQSAAMRRNHAQKSTQKFFKNVLQDPSLILTPQDLEKNATPAQIALYNVLKGFSLYRRDIGYCQGMQAVTALLLMYMTEEEAFWVLASLADDTKYQMDNLWRPNMPAIQLRFYQMERLVKITLPRLSQHFEKCMITSASMYQASQWFITIFLATDMKFNTITRVWDIYLNEGLKTVFRMGVGFLKYFEKPLLKSDFEEMLELFRTGGSKIDVDEYVKVCFSLRITHAQLAAFEKDFNRQQQQLKKNNKY